MRNPNGLNGTPIGKNKWWIDSAGKDCFLNNVIDLVPPDDDLATAAQKKLNIAEHKSEGAWVQSSRGYRRSSFARKGSFKGQDLKPSTVAPLMVENSPKQLRLIKIIEQLFCNANMLPMDESEKLLLSHEDQSLHFNMVDIYEQLKKSGAMSSDRPCGAFDLASTFSNADIDSTGEINLWQFIGALNPQIEVEAVARAAAARSRYQTKLRAEEAAHQVELLRQQQEQARYSDAAIEAQMREHIFQQEQELMLQRKEEERQRRDAFERQEAEKEKARRKENARRKAQQRRSWCEQQLLLPWEVTGL